MEIELNSASGFICQHCGKFFPSSLDIRSTVGGLRQVRPVSASGFIEHEANCGMRVVAIHFNETRMYGTIGHFLKHGIIPAAPEQS